VATTGAGAVATGAGAGEAFGAGSSLGVLKTGSVLAILGVVLGEPAGFGSISLDSGSWETAGGAVRDPSPFKRRF